MELKNDSAMEYQWLIDAAGTDTKKLAQLSLLLAGAAIAAAQNMHGRNGIEMILGMRAAVHEIGVRMGLSKEMEQAIKNIWGTIGHG